MSHALNRRSTWYLLVGALALTLGGCGPQEPRPTQAHLEHYRYAVVTFIGHDALGDRATRDLQGIGFTVLPAEDPLLNQAALADQTLWFLFQVEHVPRGMAVEMAAKDRNGNLQFHCQARRVEDSLSVDAVVEGLAPYRGDHARPAPPSGSFIEL